MNGTKTSFSPRNIQAGEKEKLVLRTDLSVEIGTHNRIAGKHPVVTSVLKPCNNGWHADVHPHRHSRPDLSKACSSHVKTHLGYVIERT